jgi:hypothetical protein
MIRVHRFFFPSYLERASVYTYGTDNNGNDGCESGRTFVIVFAEEMPSPFLLAEST